MTHHFASALRGVQNGSASAPLVTCALGPAERETVLAHLHEERFQNRSPAAIYARLLDKGNITARSAPRTGCSSNEANRANDAISLPIRLTRIRNSGDRSPSARELGQVDLVLPKDI